MSTVALVISLVSLAVALGALAAAVSLARAMRETGLAVSKVAADLDDLERQALPLLADTRAALRKAEGANAKVDNLVRTAESLTGTVDSATRLAHRVLTNPFVKVVAFFSGTRRAAQRLKEVTDLEGPAGGRMTRARRAGQRRRRP